MGIIFSRFRKQNTKDQLESIEKEIKSIHEFRVNTQQRQKRFVGALLFYSVALYVVAALAFYFYYFPNELSKQLLYSLPLLIFPVIVWLLKEALHLYFRSKLRKNETKLTELLRKKRKILEDVMETETYKVARELLEKYDPDQLKKKGGQHEDVLSNLTEPELRQRIPGSQSPASQGKGSPLLQGAPMKGLAKSPLQVQAAQGGRLLNKGGPMQGGSMVMALDRHAPPPGMQVPRPPGPPMPRPILPRERTYVDRMIEYLVGDGPNSRYALICRNCQSHNGMALKEEFEFMAFRCCYCYYWNPARKHRPAAPRLPEQQFSPTSSLEVIEPKSGEEETASSEGESESGEESELSQSIELAADKKGEAMALLSENSEVVSPTQTSTDVPDGSDPKPSTEPDVPTSEAPEEAQSAMQDEKGAEANTNANTDTPETNSPSGDGAT